MNCWQRAFCYIGRKRLRSLLLLMIFMIINCMVLGILGIQNATEEVLKDLRSNAESKVVLEIKQGEMPFSENDVQEMLKIPYINWINSLVSEKTEIAGMIPIIGNEQSDPLFTVYSQNKVEKDSPFEEQVYRLIEGNFPLSDNEILINQLLADKNGLKVGDYIQGNYNVAGIFLSGTERQQTEKVATENRIENQIYTVRSNNLPVSYTKVICYVAEPDKLAELVEGLSKKYGEKAYIRANDHTYQKMRFSIEQANRISMFVLMVTLITGSATTGLLLFMWMRGRRTEIAVFVSLGLKKSNLLMQAVTEGLALYTISFIVSEILVCVLLPRLIRMGIIEDIGGNWKADFARDLLVLGCGICMIVLLTIIAMIPYLRKHPKDIFSEMKG